MVQYNSLDDNSDLRHCISPDLTKLA